MHDLQNSQSALLTIFGLVVTFSFDLLAPKYNQFNFVPKCITQVANLGKLLEAICKVSC